MLNFTLTFSSSILCESISRPGSVVSSLAVSAYLGLLPWRVPNQHACHFGPSNARLLPSQTGHRFSLTTRLSLVEGLVIVQFLGDAGESMNFLLNFNGSSGLWFLHFWIIRKSYFILATTVIRVLFFNEKWMVLKSDKFFSSAESSDLFFVLFAILWPCYIFQH